MENILESILINTYNSDNVLRGQAEAALAQFLTANGALVALLNFISNTVNHRELRLATGIVIKNKLRDFWSDEASKYPVMSLEEKEIVKVKLVDTLLVEMDNAIRGLMAECIRIISESEYPDRWSALVPTLLNNIQNPDVLKVYNSLLALRKLIKRFEYKQREARKPLLDLIQVSFPYLQQLMTVILQHNTIEAASVMRLCLKIFWSATLFTLPLTVSGVDVNLWFQMIAFIINKPLPEASEGIEPLHQPIQPEERKAWPWWKLKKWAGRIITHFIQRYGNPRYADEECKQFAEYFRSHTANQLLGPVMNTLLTQSKGIYVTEDMHRMCISFVSSCVEMSPTYKVIKPHLDFILFQVVFPTLGLTKDEIELFSEDPVEFVRKVHSPLEDWLSPQIAATTLLQMLARYRQKDTLPKMLPYVNAILVEYNNTPPEARNYQKKDGALVTIATLAKILGDSKTYASHLHPFLTTHVLPEFTSPIPFLRSRACWVIEYFHEVDWTANKGATLQAVLQGLLQGLRDPALPVQAAAACSLRLLISAEGATDLLRPMLPEIITEYFRIMEEVENESVLSALQAIVTQFGDEISGMAPYMCTHLISAFNGYANQGNDDDEAAFNATQCLDTISSVLDAVQEHADVLEKLEPILVPLLHSLLNNGDDCYEYIDCAVQMMSYLTYYSDTVTPTMWSLAGPLLQALFDWAIDYISEIMVPILNYISKDCNTFLQLSHNGQPLAIILLQIIEKTFENDESDSSRDSKAASTLLTCLVTCSRASQTLNGFMPNILSITMSKLATTKLNSMKVRLLEVVMGVIYYEPTLALSILSTDVPATTALFTTLFDNLKDMERDFTQRLIALSFSSLLTIPQQSLPEILRNNLQAMFQQVIRELVMIEEEERTGAKLEAREGSDEGDDDFEFGDENSDDGVNIDDDDEDEGEDDEEEEAPKKKGGKHAKSLDVPEGGYDEDEDCLNAEDESYREVLESMDKEERVKRELYLAGEPVDDEDDEDFIFTSPIENMNITQFFLDTVTGVQQRDAGLIATLQSCLDAEDTARLQELIASAAKKAQEALAAQQQSSV